jgi:biotin carboxylase
MHVLHIGARPEALRALHRGGHEITVLYEAGDGRRMDRTPGLRALATRACAVDSYRVVESLWSAIHHLDQLAPLPKVDAVLTTHEYAVVPAAVLGAQLGAIAADPEMALACRDKAVQKRRWQAAGIRTARHLVLTDALTDAARVAELVAAAGLAFPVIVKPVAAGGGIAVSVARSAEEVVAAAGADDDLRRILVEEFVDAPEWHVDGVVRDGAIEAMMVSQYGEPLLCTKQGRPMRSVSYPPTGHPELYAEAAEITGRALAALGVATSVFHFELFGGPGAFVANELACRPGGSMLGRVAEKTIGVDLWAAATQLYTGDPVEALRGADGVHGWTHLPSVPGQVNRVREDDIRAAVPGVDRTVLLPVGAPMGDMSETTSTGIGYAVVSAPDRAACHAAMDALVARVWELHAARRPEPFAAGGRLRTGHRARMEMR